MPEEKKKRGRPRIYKDDAEKFRVYRQKQKEKMKLLEEKVASLEGQQDDSKDASKDSWSWHNWTFKKLKEFDIQTLKSTQNKIMRNIKSYTIYSPLKVIVDALISDHKASLDKKIFDEKNIRDEIIKYARNYDQVLVDVTIYYLIELELSQRFEEEKEFDYEIHITEQRIEELEKIIEDMKKSKTITKTEK